MNQMNNVHTPCMWTLSPHTPLEELLYTPACNTRNEHWESDVSRWAYCPYCGGHLIVYNPDNYLQSW